MNKENELNLQSVCYSEPTRFVILSESFSKYTNKSINYIQ